jgi:hypothetical protein
MGEFWLVKNKEELSDRIEFFAQYLEREWNWEHPVQWRVSRYSGKASKSQKALWWMWCDEMARHFRAGGADIDKERMAMMLKNKFLGTEDIYCNNTVIQGQVRHTSDLSPGEMCEFMDQVLAWALDCGVTLTCPADSEYMKLKGG